MTNRTNPIKCLPLIGKNPAISKAAELKAYSEITETNSRKIKNYGNETFYSI